MKNLATLLFLAICLFFTSCLHHQYIPNTHNQPMLTKKGDQRISGGLASPNFFQSGDFQFAKAVHHKYGVIANGSWTLSGQNESKLKGGMMEIGAGRFWFRPNEYAEAGKPDGAVFEIYGGAGWGGYFNKYVDGDDGSSIFFPPPTPGVPIRGDSKVSFTRLFLQPSVGYLNSAIELGISTRISYLDYLSGTFTGNDPEAKKIYRYLLEEKNQFVVFEPAVTVRMGWRKMKFQGQMGFSTIPEIIGSKFYISGGLIYTIRK